MSAKSDRKVAALLDEAKQLGSNPVDIAALGSLVKKVAAAALSPIETDGVLGAIKDATGVGLGTLRKQLASEAAAVCQASGVDQPPWFAELLVDGRGTPLRNEANALIALQDAEFAGTLAYDEFSLLMNVLKPLPWDKKKSFKPRLWCDNDDTRLAEWMQWRDVNVTPAVACRAAVAFARQRSFHPVRTYLDGLKWDGKKRLDTWLTAYLGAEDSPLHRAIGAKWLISAVARIRQPGVKVDHTLVLEGEQGIKKTTLLEILASPEWYTDELPALGSKDCSLQLQGKWIVEMSELDALNKVAWSRTKAFLTRKVDEFRPPYGRHTAKVPRQGVFAGTVNEDAYLEDDTGNRRFWPLKCGDVKLDELARDRDQLWAEAQARYTAGESWWITNEATLAAVKAAQAARHVGDAWEETILNWLALNKKKIDANVTVSEIMECLQIPVSRRDQGVMKRISGVLRRNGWEPHNPWNKDHTAQLGRRFRRKIVVSEASQASP